MVSIDPACGTSSAFSCAGSKSPTVTSRSSSGSHPLRAPDHHRPTKLALGNIVQALVERTFAWLRRCRRLATAEFATLRLRLLKMAARVVETTSRIRLAFAAACPEADLFRSLPGALLPLGP